MSKAARLSPTARRALSETVNATLLHACEHGHERCATRTGAACAEEAAELQHAARMSSNSATAAPVKSEQTQQSLF